MDSAKFHSLVRSDLRDYCPASNLAFNEKIKKLIAQGETIYHFGFGQAPFPIMEGMVSALKKHAGENAYLQVAGISELRQAVCDLHKKYDNVSFNPEQVIVGPGSKELIYLLMNVFQGDIMVVSPTWTTYKPQTQLSGHTAVVISTTYENEWRITPQQLEKAITVNKITGNKLLVLCNPDNPTGTSYTQEHWADLSKVFRKHNVIVLMDEIYARLHYTQNHQSLVKHYPEGTILSSGFSKWASAGGWRVGYQIYPPSLESLQTAVRSAASHTYSCAPAPQQYALAEALKNEEEIDQYIRHTSRIMSAVGEHCYRELTAVGVKVVKSTSGYYIFPNFEVVKPALEKRGIRTGEEFCKLVFEEAKVALMSGGPAFLRPVDEFTTRLSYVNFDGTEALEESIRIGLKKDLPETFVQNLCNPVYMGIKALKEWVQATAA